MKSIKIKEFKDDAIIEIKINKTFYMMCKASIFSIFKELHSIENENPETFIKNITSQSFDKLNDKERIFFVLSLLIGEIEKQIQDNNLYTEKEISEKDIKLSNED